MCLHTLPRHAPVPISMLVEKLSIKVKLRPAQLGQMAGLPTLVTGSHYTSNSLLLIGHQWVKFTGTVCFHVTLLPTTITPAC